jgi:Arc/MetJ-type ribon-helix-helix transcriptional regulator
MVIGMATRKVTITLDEQDLSRIKSLVESGKARTVSGFVQSAVRVSLDDVAGWSEMLAEALAKTGGDLTADERAWADRILGTGKRRRRPGA